MSAKWYEPDGTPVGNVPVLRGQVEPPALPADLGILPSGEIRPSTREKARVIEHINESYAAGRLTDAQAEARRDAVAEMEARSQLGRITADLPPMPPMPRTDNVRSNPQHIVGVGFAMLALGVLVFVVSVGANIHPFWAQVTLGLTGLGNMLGSIPVLAHASYRLTHK